MKMNGKLISKPMHPGMSTHQPTVISKQCEVIDPIDPIDLAHEERQVLQKEVQ